MLWCPYKPTCRPIYGGTSMAWFANFVWGAGQKKMKGKRYEKWEFANRRKIIRCPLKESWCPHVLTTWRWACLAAYIRTTAESAEDDCQGRDHLRTSTLVIEDVITVTVFQIWEKFQAILGRVLAKIPVDMCLNSDKFKMTLTRLDWQRSVKLIAAWDEWKKNENWSHHSGRSNRM